MTALVFLAAALQPADPPPRFEAVRSVAFSPDGRRVAAGFGRDDEPGGVAVWDARSHKPLWTRPGAATRSVSFAADGASLVVADGGRAAVRFDAATGRLVGELGPHPADVRFALHVPGTDLVATASDGTVRLWDVRTGKVAKELTGGHPDDVWSLVVSPTGKWLISASSEATRIWDVVAGTEVKGVLNHDRRVGYWGIAFLGPDRVMMADNSGTRAVRDLPRKDAVLRFANAGYGPVATAPAAGLVAYCDRGHPRPAVAELTFRDPTPVEREAIGKLLRDFDDDSFAVREAASKAVREIGTVAEPALRKAMTDGPSAEVRMRAREARRAVLEEPLRRLTGHAGGVTAMAFSPDGAVLATAADDGTVRLWNPRTGAELARLAVPPPSR